MNVLRRPEVMVLLALVAGGLAWVLWTRPAPEPAEAAPAGAGVKIEGVTVHPENGHLRVRVAFSAFHAGAEPLPAGAPAVVLRRADGRPVPEFFSPGSFPPELAPGARSATAVEYWLPAEAAGQTLMLEALGERLEISVPEP